MFGRRDDSPRGLRGWVARWRALRPRLAFEALEARQLLTVAELTAAPALAEGITLGPPQLADGGATKEPALTESLAQAVAMGQSPRLLNPDHQWLVQLDSQTPAEALAALAGVVGLEPATLLGQAYLVTLDPEIDLEGAERLWSTLSGVQWTDPLLPRIYDPRWVPDDPLFPQQWNLNNTGQSGGVPGVDARLVSAWDLARGSGVVIGIVDNGVQVTQPDLAPNYLASASYDFNGNDPDPSPNPGQAHGTNSAGVAVARGNNGIGLSGAAPEAALAALRLTSAAVTDVQASQALGYLSQEIDIYSVSWGPTDDGLRLEGPGPLTRAALAQAATSGRGGLGSIFVWAAGNGRLANDNVNYDGYANSRFVMAVSAINANGVRAFYSEPGAPILVAAPSSGIAGSTVTTTDLVGSEGASAGDYSASFGGTSAAAPLVAGIAALMLEVNPQLSARDVAQILIDTAQHNDPNQPDWVTNGAGRWVNHNYGFGAVDAAAAVAAAAQWKTLAPEVTYHSPVVPVLTAIADNSPVGVTSTINIPDDFSVERVEVTLSATHTFRGDLEIVLTSPDGTQSVLAEKHNDSGDNYSGWTFSSVRHWGETSQGDWQLRIRDLSAGDVGTFVSWQLNLYGAPRQGPPPLKVIEQSLSDQQRGPISELVLRFSRPVDPASFDPAEDLLSFTGPAGDLLGALTATTWEDSERLRIEFAPQTIDGVYTLVLGPEVLAAADGALLDQDGDGLPGEPLEDGYTASFAILGPTSAGLPASSISGSKWNDRDGNGQWDPDEPPLANWQIYLDLNENGQFDGQATREYLAADPPRQIIDLATIGSTQTVVGLPGPILDLDLELSIQHSFVGDLSAVLIAPDGTRVTLFADVGGAGDDFIQTWFDDEAASAIADAPAPRTGSFRPSQPLSAFEGRLASGTWRLELTDDAPLDDGVLLGWTLRITVAEPSALTNSEGIYQLGALPPGVYQVREVPQDPWQQTYPAPVPIPPAGGDAPVLQGQWSLTTTASTEPVYALGIPQGAEVPLPDPRPRLQQSGPKVGIDQLRADPRFADVDGRGWSVVVIDGGIDVDHPFFGPDADENGIADRLVYQYDFADGDNDASDPQGHGSNVASIVGSQDVDYQGMAPGADLIALKVFTNSGASQFAYVEAALQWVVAHVDQYHIAAVNLSLGDQANHAANLSLYGLGDELQALAELGVIVVGAAGNNFFPVGGAVGVAYPAADPNVIGVGAVWDSDAGGPIAWPNGAVDITTGADRIASFSQRHPTLGSVFAPGALITGAGASGGLATYAGTSQAAPHVTGIAVLAQQLAQQWLGRRLTGAEFKALVEQTGVDVVDGDDENDDVDNTGLTFQRIDAAALAQAIVALAPHQPGSHVITLGAGEAVVGVDFGNHDPTYLNLPPELQPVPQVTVSEGDSFSIQLAGTDPDAGQQLTYHLAPGAPVGMTLDPHTGLLSWTPDDNTTEPLVVGVTVTDDGWPAQSVTQTFQISVLNVAPTVVLSAQASAYRGEVVTVDLQALDPGAQDTAAAFTWEIDWDSDGLYEESFAAGPQAMAAHHWSALGTLTFQVRAIDKDGGVSTPVAHSVTVSEYELRANPDSPSLTDLIWGGTPGLDAVYFFNQPNGIRIFTQFENLQLVNRFTTVVGVTGRVIAYGFAGSDVLIGEFLINRPASLYGGEGNDVLVGGWQADLIDGGPGDDILLGGTRTVDGADTLLGGQGADLLWGNFGSDSLSGGAGQDLLLGDAYHFDNVPAAVFAVQAEWLSDRTYLERVANLKGLGTGPRLNGNVALGPGTSTLADGAVDTLIGGPDEDWLIGESGFDVFEDSEAGEEQTNNLGGPP